MAATVAHIAIDVAGDYLLVRDAYDGVAHHSRTLLLAIVGIGVLAAAVRAIFEALDRRCPSKTSLLAAIRSALGNPVSFAVASAAVATVVLIGMEAFDSSLTGQLADLEDLFGGSVALGAGTAVVVGALFGWLVHRIVGAIARFEAPIVAFIVAAFNLRIVSAPRAVAYRRFGEPIAVGRALRLSRQGRKRGPPAPVFG
ncbi:MAG: hypothetical protein JOY69_05585 [Candidatus Eremiobacteraeota bacterium]|nr:hypothetical protein [Candidatus Eremiobacteraeota bacterium]